MHFVMVELLVEHFAPRVQPGDPPAVAGGNSDLMNLLTASESFGHAFTQRVEPFSGCGGDWHHVVPPARFLDQP